MSRHWSSKQDVSCYSWIMSSFPWIIYKSSIGSRVYRLTYPQSCVPNILMGEIFSFAWPATSPHSLSQAQFNLQRGRRVVSGSSAQETSKLGHKNQEISSVYISRKSTSVWPMKRELILGLQQVMRWMQLANDGGKVTNSLTTVLATWTMQKAAWGSMVFPGYTISPVGACLVPITRPTLLPHGSPTI